MKKVKSDEIRSEYKREDLGPGVRGKYYESYKQGTNIILLNPDVAEFFPDEESVNKALRSLIDLARKSTGQKRQMPGRTKKEKTT
ncbi:MAG TPA: hypothetical protein PK878_09470 [bacterium]|nr:hypothetical protein [bacterium]HOL96540.1 hypothetical protein [bacterium]HPP00762.1 hypothetical protein [bacterium]HXK95804.1 hypothetical protein [bacterium]